MEAEERESPGVERSATLKSERLAFSKRLGLDQARGGLSDGKSIPLAEFSYLVWSQFCQNVI